MVVALTGRWAYSIATLIKQTESDAHCLYPDNYAAKVLDALEKNKADCVVVPMLTIGRTRFQYAVAAAQNSVLGTGGSAHRHLGDGCFVEHGGYAMQ